LTGEGRAAVAAEATSRATIGVLPGEGVGPSVVDAALSVLAAVDSGDSFDVRFGGPIGTEAQDLHGTSLSDEVAQFCDDVFSTGGVVLAGAGGGRFVYELRRRFDLFWKVSPLRVSDALAGAGALKAEHVSGVDVAIVREGVSGLYQGSSERHEDGRRAEHRYGSTHAEVARVVDAAAGLARERRGRLAVVVKKDGIPALSELWAECAHELASDLEVELLDVDYGAYLLLQEPRELDVVVAPNMFGDVLSDLGGVLLGSRGLTYGGNFSTGTAAVYQTNHGAAFDLTGTDRANPAGQILSVAMLLRESLGRAEDAALIEASLEAVWSDGYRTFDVAEPGCTVVGTRELAERAVAAVAELAESRRARA
jgi:3-isopropylmalate dehydrogenase